MGIGLFGWFFLSLISASLAVTFSDPTLAAYYKDVASSNLVGQPLKTALSKLISSDVTVLSYDQIWKAFDAIDEYSNGIGCSPDQIEDVYSSKCWKDQQECGNYKKVAYIILLPVTSIIEYKLVNNLGFHSFYLYCIPPWVSPHPLYSYSS